MADSLGVNPKPAACTAAKTAATKTEMPKKEQCERDVVLIGGFYDDHNEYPCKLAKHWRANGVPENRIHMLPNNYVGVNALCSEKPVSSCKGWFGACLSFIKQKIDLFCATIQNMFKFKAFEQPANSQTTQDVEKLNDTMKSRGYTPENPVVISVVAHSGGGARATSLAKYAHNQKLSFKIVEITTLGSPLTEANLKNIPDNVEANLITSKQDRVYHTVTRLSPFAPAMENIGFGSISSEICPNPQRFLKPGSSYLELEDEGHSGYHENHSFMQRLVKDTLTAEY